MSENGVKPSVHRPNLTFGGSATKFGYFWSKYFHAYPSDGCQRTSDSWWCSWCHLMWATVLFEAYSLCNLGIKDR